jgi:large conductance mechanosensitive channel
MAMKSLWHEFKAFAFKGNMIDLAIAVVIGATFGKVVDSLVKSIIMPILSYVIPNQGGYTAWMIGRVEIGKFLGEVMNFLIVAAAVFIVIVKVLGYLMKMRKAEEPAAAPPPTTRECPMCCSVISVKAKRCAHCTADLEGAAI